MHSSPHSCYRDWRSGTQNQIGSKVGIYASFQALGMGMAPLIGGISADTEWRAAFWGTVFISILLSIFPLMGNPVRFQAHHHSKPITAESHPHRIRNFHSCGRTHGGQCPSRSRCTRRI